MISGICLVAGALGTFVPAPRFTLAWMHSIEKIRWEEDYVASEGELRLVEARIRGSGAGMEPPDGARLRDGAWHYHPTLDRFARLVLARSRFTADYEICYADRCHPMGEYVPIEAGTTTLVPASAAATCVQATGATR